MSESHLPGVVRQRAGGFAVGQRAVAVLRHAPPRAEVHLVDGHRLRQALFLFPRREPLRVSPAVVEVPHDRSRPGRHFLADGEGVRLVDRVAVEERGDVVLVDGPLLDARQEAFPDSGLADRLERMRARLPRVEVPDDRNRGGIRREDAEGRAANAVELAEVRAQLVVEPGVVALVEEEEVFLGQPRGVIARRSCSRHRHRGRPSFLRQRCSFRSPKFTRPEYRIMRGPWTAPRSSFATTSSPRRTERPRTASSAVPSATAILGVIDAPDGRPGRRRSARRPSSAASRSSRRSPDALRALRRRPDFCVVGVATSGGRVTPGLRAPARRGDRLSACRSSTGCTSSSPTTPSCRPPPARQGVSITRRPQDRAADRAAFLERRRSARSRAPRIAVLGTDCALGKRTTARFLIEACRAAGLRTELIFTGQTGWMQGAPYGFIFDSMPERLRLGRAGARRRLLLEEREAADLILFEGSPRCATRRARAAPSSCSRAERAASSCSTRRPATFYEGLEELGLPDPSAGRRDRSDRDVTAHGRSR